MLQVLVNALCTGSGLALVAAGFALIYFTTDVFHIAHGAACLLAAYLTSWVLLQTSDSATPSAGQLFIACAVGVVAAALFGFLVEILVYRPLFRQGAAGTVMLASSLGVYIVAVNALVAAVGSGPQTLLPGTSTMHRAGGVVLTSAQLVLLGSAGPVLAAFVLSIRATRAGLFTRAVGDDPLLAATLGVNVLRVRTVVFLAGSALAGLGAILLALDVGVDPGTGLSQALVGGVATLIAGRRWIWGPGAAAIFLAILQGLVAWGLSSAWQDATTFGVLLITLIARPEWLQSATRPERR